MTPLAIALGLAGLAWGVAADRIAARWPEHLPEGPDGETMEGAAEDGPAPEGSAQGGPGAAARLPQRGVDWRTVVVAVVGGVALFLLPGRFAGPQLVLFGAWVVTLVLMLATDLDQRLLPDVLTLPLIPAAAVIGLVGLNPFVPDRDLVLAVAAAVVFPAIFLALSIPFGQGAIGMGDLKLLVSVGLILGFWRAFGGVAVGALLSGVVVAVLLVTRRIGRRSYIPYGPFLIVGTLWAALITP